jgi:hypothetical protein
MKNLFLAVAVCAVSLGMASCAQETVERNSQDGVLSFKPVLGKQTRVGETTLGSLEAAESVVLKVEAFHMGDADVWETFSLTHDNSHGSGEWVYSPEVYQPGFQVRYYSVYPDSAVTDAAASADNYTFDFTVAATAASQEDLIVAKAGPTIEEAIALQYSHLLSQVNFAVQAIPEVKIVITNLAVSGVKNKNTYTFDTTAGATAGWGIPSTTDNPTPYAYTPVAAAEATLAAGESDAIVYLGNGNGTYSNNNALMLMPQTFTTTSTGIFSFDFSLTVNTDHDESFEDETPKTGTATVNFGDFDQLTWAPGKRYVYVIDFTSYITGGPITFTVSVTDWADADAPHTAQVVEVADATAHSLKAAIELQAAVNTSTLTTFPISVPSAIAETLTIPTIYGFDAGDKIRIECLNAASAGNIDFTQAGWSKSIENTSVVVLTCTTPTIQGATETANVSAVENDTDLIAAIHSAITDLHAAPTTSKFTEYTVNVGKDFLAAGGVLTPGSLGNFAAGDVIRLVFPNTSTNNIVTATDWTVTTNGAEVILTRNALQQ